VLALVVAACSGDDADSTEPDLAATSTLPPTSATTAPPVFVGDAGSPFCALLEEAAVDEALQGDGEDPAAVADAFGTVVDVLQEAATLAPTEIVADVTLVAEGMAALDAALAAVDYDFDALAASGAAPEVLAAVNDPVFADAGVRLAAYRSQVCGL
jgi:hypothetical protein